MKRLKKAMRLISMISMIVLACFGVGISGTPPVLPKLDNRAKIEYAEEKEDGENE